MSDAPEPARVTVVLTSCGRFDLLERCLRGFQAFNTHPVERFILMEDSGDPGVREVAAAVDPAIEVHVASPPLGQVNAIDRAYAMVETPWIFHCEDDYVFHRGGFIEEGLRVLEADPTISMVSGRGKAGIATRFDPDRVPVSTVGGVTVQVPPRAMHPAWYGYAFHPGLRRRSDWERFGPFAPYRREWDVSYAMKRAGLRMAYLAPPAFVDDDRGTMTSDSDPARPRNLARHAYRLRKSLKKYLFYAERAMGRYAD